jgi:hypothetical protein
MLDRVRYYLPCVNAMSSHHPALLRRDPYARRPGIRPPAVGQPRRPEVVALEIVEDLRAALEEYELVLSDLSAGA